MEKSEKKINLSSALYIIATPIGNLLDITYRAINILRSVDLIAAENIHKTNILLNNFSIKKSIISINKNNEKKQTKLILNKIINYKLNIALVSRAGTPLISDPGYYLVRSCHDIGIKVIPIPGACALTVALSGSGVSTNKFIYEGFIPKKKKMRYSLFKLLKYETRTLIFYESSKRILESLEDMLTILGPERYVVIARELTKLWENIKGMNIEKLLIWIKKDKKRTKGEITLLVEGYKYNKSINILPIESLNTFKILLNKLTKKEAIKVTSKIHGFKKNLLYNYINTQK